MEAGDFESGQDDGPRESGGSAPFRRVVKAVQSNQAALGRGRSGGSCSLRNRDLAVTRCAGMCGSQALPGNFAW